MGRVSLGYWYLSTDGAYMGNRCISPFGRYVATMWRNRQHAKSRHPEAGARAEIRSVRGPIGAISNHLPIATENLTRDWVAQEVEDQTVERDGCGGMRLKTTMRPQYDCLRRTKIRSGFIDVWLGDGEIGGDLGESFYMFGRNQLGCQHPRFACDRSKEFVRWGGWNREMIEQWASV